PVTGDLDPAILFYQARVQRFWRGGVVRPHEDLGAPLPLAGGRRVGSQLVVSVRRHQRNLMRGSSQASRRSDNSVPMTVRTDSIMMKLPARYMSCDCNALSSSGPVVGKLSTIETMAAPDTRSGSTQPTVLTNGLSATRTGYFRSRRGSLRPLARAV